MILNMAQVQASSTGLDTTWKGFTYSRISKDFLWVYSILKYTDKSNLIGDQRETQPLDIANDIT